MPWFKNEIHGLAGTMWKRFIRAFSSRMEDWGKSWWAEIWEGTKVILSIKQRVSGFGLVFGPHGLCEEYRWAEKG